MDIYFPSVIADLQAFYGPMLYDRHTYPLVGPHLTAIADRMWIGVQTQHKAVLTEISNHHPAYLGYTTDELAAFPLTPMDCQHAIAAEYGFGTWSGVQNHYHLRYDQEFERAIDYLLSGQLTELELLIRQFPDLVRQRSQYGHQATLLHYVASNGVEMWRQQVPANLPALTQSLLEAGADPQATMRVYGGDFQTLALLETSAHPQAAGIAPSLEALFRPSPQD